jgi:dihydropyrimidinase
MRNSQFVADLLIRNGTIVNAGNVFEASIVIKDEKIVALTQEEYAPPAKQYIDAAGKYLFPGLMDIHVHFYYDDLSTLAQSAAYGGLTTILPFIRGGPEESILGNIRKYKEEGKQVSVVDFGFHVYLFDRPSFLEEIVPAMQLGVNSFKMFLGYKKRGMMVSTEFMLKAFKIIQANKGMGMVHAEEGEIIDYLEDQAISAGAVGVADFSKTCPDVAEEIAIIRAVELAHMSNCPLYIVHLSTAKGLKHIREAQKAGKNIFVETCPQYLLLTDEDMIRHHGPNAKIGPPLRSKEDNAALWEGLRDRTISVVSTDHSAHSKKSKEPGWKNIFQAPFGMIGVETVAPLTYFEGVVKRNFPLTWFAKVMSENPAKIFGLYPKKGVIRVGADADITIFDPEKEVTIQTAHLHSKAGYSVYDGWKVKGYPVMTVLRGHILLNHGKLEQNPGYGKFLSRPIAF